MTRAPELRFDTVETISDGWYMLRKYTFGFQRRDGTWQQLQREACHRGDSVGVLLVCRARGTVILIRQFRLPAFLGRNSDGMLLEVASGLIGDDGPDSALRREIEEETGYRVADAERILVTHLSPTLVTERSHLFIAEVDDAVRTSNGGGVQAEGEDIEVVEMPFDEAFAMIATGQIVDAKTIILLYHAKQTRFCHVKDAK